MLSNTNTGPVLPKIVKGCPPNKPNITPHTMPETKLSIAD